MEIICFSGGSDIHYHFHSSPDICFMPDFLLEIACFSLQAAMHSEASGAQRIELCDNPLEGGTTPSYGTLKMVRETIDIPVFPIIRPRGGHFVFTLAEIAVMQQDIRLCKALGYEGVVIGLLNADATVDYETTARLVELAYPMEVTFHRAFDRTPDPFAALSTIMKAGCTRILTSGQVPDVNLGAGLVANLIKAADNDLIIMPGSGVRAKGIAQLAATTGATEFHSSASFWEDEPFFSPPSMNEHLQQNKVNKLEIKNMLAALEGHFQAP
jgi:copper homeostasis protein